MMPLLFVAIACVVNIVGDYVFVAVFGMDQSGAALATVMSQGVSVILSMAILAKTGLPFSIRARDLKPGEETKTILKISAPLALQETLTQISFLAILAFINAISLEASSGYGIASKIVSFVMLIPSSLMQSMSSFVAQNAGAGLQKRAVKSMLTGMGIGCVIGTITFLLAFFFGEEISLLFTSDPEVARRSAEYLRGFAPEAVVTAFLFSFIGYFNGRGQTVFVMVQGLAQTLLVRLPLSWAMSRAAEPSLTLIGLAAPTATCFGILINLVWFIRMRRKDKLSGADK